MLPSAPSIHGFIPDDWLDGPGPTCWSRDYSLLFVPSTNRFHASRWTSLQARRGYTWCQRHELSLGGRHETRAVVREMVRYMWRRVGSGVSNWNRKTTGKAARHVNVDVLAVIKESCDDTLRAPVRSDAESCDDTFELLVCCNAQSCDDTPAPLVRCAQWHRVMRWHACVNLSTAIQSHAVWYTWIFLHLLVPLLLIIIVNIVFYVDLLYRRCAHYYKWQPNRLVYLFLVYLVGLLHVTAQQACLFIICISIVGLLQVIAQQASLFIFIIPIIASKLANLLFHLIDCLNLWKIIEIIYK